MTRGLFKQAEANRRIFCISYRLGLLLLSLSSLLSMPVATAEPTPKPILISELLRWIGEQTDYDITPFLVDPPEITFCECGEVIQYEGESLTVHEPIKGLYDKEANKIFLTSPWRADNIDHIGTLLHELIHFVQYNSREWPCWQRTEWEAYKLQEQWLREQGREPIFNWVRIYYVSRCEEPRDIHPSRY